MPLCGDLRNQGLSEQTSAITTTPTWATVGKIGGKSLYTKTRQTTMHFPDLVGVSTYSVAYWLYIPTAVASTAWADMFGIAFNCAGTTVWERDERRAATTTGRHNYHLAKSASEGSNTNAYYGTREDDSANDNWVHYVLTKDNSSAKLYANGTLVVTVPAANFESTKRTMTGDVYFGDNGCEAYLNDFRIYDHCLSEIEIKKLAQGLILHYPLNRGGMGQENLWRNGSCQNDLNNMAQSTNKFTITTKDGYKCAYLSGQLDTTGLLRIPDAMLPTAGDWYTISVDMRIDNYSAGSTNPYVGIYFGGDYLNTDNTGGWYGGSSYSGDGMAASNVFVNTYNNKGWHRVTCTVQYLHGGSEYKKGAFYLGYIYARDFTGDLYVKNIKFEKGKIATPWCPNVSDELATTMGLNDSIEYDISGYCNNGTRTGTFSWTSDTPKYSVSQYFNGSSYIKTFPGEFSWSNYDNLTIAAWVKPTTTPSSWTGSIGIAHDGSYNYKLFGISNYGGKFTVHTVTGTAWTSTQSTYVCPLNEWHHYVATLEGTTCKMYIDGALNKTFTVDWGTATNHSSPQFQIGVDLPGTDEIYTGYYSDARIYATALSADDVKSLYQNCATIGPDGTIYGQIRS